MKKIFLLLNLLYVSVSFSQGYIALDSLTSESGAIKIKADIQPLNVQTGDIQAESLTINTDLNVVGNTNVNIVNATVINTSTLVSTNITAESDLHITTQRDNTSTLIIGGSGGAVEGEVNQSATPIKIIPNHTNGKGVTSVELYARSRSLSNSGGENSAVRQALVIPSDYMVIPYVWDTLGYFEVSELNEVNTYLRVGATMVGEGVVQTVQSDVSILWVHSGLYHIVSDVKVNQVGSISTDTNRVATVLFDLKEDMNPSGLPKVYVRVKVLSDLEPSYNKVYVSEIPNLCSNKFILK